MKKLTYLLGLFLIGGMLFSSCTNDDDDPTAPTVNFLGGVYEPWSKDYVDGDVTLDVGEAFVFGISASTTSDKNLSNIKITRNYENVFTQVVMDSAVSVATFSVSIETTALIADPGTEEFVVVVTDKNGLTATISFVVTTVEPDPGIYEYTEIDLGSYQSATNSSFASITGETFSLGEANDDADIQAKISWIYFHGNTYGHCMMSPANTAIKDIYPAVEDWTNRNTTFFAKTELTVEQYNQVTNQNMLIAVIQGTGVSLTSDLFSELLSNPGGFAVGDIIAFETGEGGNQGLIRLTEVNPGATNGESTIKYNIKVEKD